MVAVAWRRPAAAATSGTNTLAGVGNLLTWIVAGITLAALAVAYLTYRSQRANTRIEYVVTTNRTMLPGQVASDLEVR